MSVLKLLSRMGVDRTPSAELHNESLGITSDPLMQFACVFSYVSCLALPYYHLFRLRIRISNHSPRIVKLAEPLSTMPAILVFPIRLWLRKQAPW